MTGLGICYPKKDYWLHCFTASTLAHCTSTPLFWLYRKVYVRRPHGVDIFAYGKSEPSTGVTPQRSTHHGSVWEGGEFDPKMEKLVVMDPKIQSEVA